MSRSRRKTPIIPHTLAESDKPFKQQEHQRERSAVRDALRTDQEVLPHPKQFGDEWSAPKDGKQYYPKDKKALRK